MSVMAKRKRKTGPANRQGSSLTVWISTELKNALERYIDETRPHPTTRACVETALEDFLSKAGYWPPEKN